MNTNFVKMRGGGNPWRFVCPGLQVLFLLGMIVFSAGTLRGLDYISYVGAEIDNGARWLTPSVEKSLLTNGTNVYGSVTATDWKSQGWGSALGGGVTLQSAAGIDGGSTNGRPIDNPLDPSNMVNAGFITAGSVNNGFTIAFTQAYIDSYGTSARLGMMYDVLADGFVPVGSSQRQEISLQQSGGIYTRASVWTAVENRNPDIYFFDIVGIKANESYSFLFTDKNFTNHQPLLGALMIDPIPSRSAGNGMWNIQFTNPSGVNFLDTTKDLPSRALRDISGTWTSAVARLDGPSAGVYESLTLAGLNKTDVYRFISTENGVSQTQFFVPGAKGEATAVFGATPASPFALTLGSDFIQNAESITLNVVEPSMVVSVDLQSVTASASMKMSGPDGVTGYGGVWNVYDFENWKGNGTKGTPGYAKTLVDSEGNATPIQFSTEGWSKQQELVGWPDNAGSGNPLFGDYLFGNHEGYLVTSSPLEWEISGLVPGDLYQLIMFGAQGRSADITVFDEIHGLETQTAPTQGAAYYFACADALGTISGTFGNLNATSEQNWSGFHLLAYDLSINDDSTVPEPATWGMLLAGLLAGAVFYGKKREL